MAATSAAGILGAIAATRIGRRFGTARGMLLATLVTFPLALLVPLTRPGPGLVFLVVGYTATGAGVSIAVIICRSFWQTYCPPHLLGRVIATLQFLTQGAVPLGALLAGLLGNTLGNRTTLWLIAGVLVCAALLLRTSRIRRYRNLPINSPGS